MADEATRRRELRRRRILENAEERKNKIFGTSAIDANSNSASENPDAAVEKDASPSPLNNASSKDEGSVKDVPLVKDSRTLPALSTSRTSEPQNSVIFDRGHDSNESDLLLPSSFRAENGIESVPEIAEQLRNINSLLTAGGGGGLNTTQTRKLNSSDVQPTPVLGALSTPIVPVILALFVCILLNAKLDYVVSSSIALPFVLWEAHNLWCKRHVLDASSRGVGGLLGLALVLCGVQQTVTRKMTWIMTVFRCVFEDFSFYILTVVLWYWIVGLPGSVQVANEFGEPETVQVTATDEEELYNNMEEF